MFHTDCRLLSSATRPFTYLSSETQPNTQNQLCQFPTFVNSLSSFSPTPHSSLLVGSHCHSPSLSLTVHRHRRNILTHSISLSAKVRPPPCHAFVVAVAAAVGCCCRCRHARNPLPASQPGDRTSVACSSTRQLWLYTVRFPLLPACLAFE